MKEADPQVKQGETYALAVRAVCPGEHSISVNVAQASEGLPAQASLAVQHLKQSCSENLLRKCSFRPPECCRGRGE